MIDGATRVRRTLDAWREQAADRFDPVRFHMIEALEQRAARHEGEVRRLLDERLSALLADYANLIAQKSAQPTVVADARDANPLGKLAAGLVERNAAPYPELPMLGDFRQLWSRLRTESQLRQSLQPAPANAGPLNSSALAHRAIALMRELSPGYLRHFLGYVDALSWMEQLGGSSPLPAKEAPAPKKRSRRPRA